MNLVGNAYYDTTDTRWERIAAGYATRMLIEGANGDITMYGAASDNADTAIVWKEILSIGFGAGSVIVNDGQEDIDFRVYWGDGPTIYADGGSGRVGIGTDTPLAAKLTVFQGGETGESCLSLKQDDLYEGFIDYVGTEQRGIAFNENSAKSVMIEINGEKYLMAAYAVT